MTNPRLEPAAAPPRAEATAAAAATAAAPAAPAIALGPAARRRTRLAGLLLGTLLSAPSLAVGTVLVTAYEQSRQAVFDWPVFLVAALALAGALWLPWLMLRRVPGVARPWATVVSSFGVVLASALVIDLVIGTAASVSYALTIVFLWSGDLLVPIVLLACAVSLLLTLAVSLPVLPAFARSFLRRALASPQPAPPPES